MSVMLARRAESNLAMHEENSLAYAFAVSAIWVVIAMLRRLAVAFQGEFARLSLS